MTAFLFNKIKKQLLPLKSLSECSKTKHILVELLFNKALLNDWTLLKRAEVSHIPLKAYTLYTD